MRFLTAKITPAMPRESGWDPPKRMSQCTKCLSIHWHCHRYRCSALPSTWIASQATSVATHEAAQNISHHSIASNTMLYHSKVFHFIPLRVAPQYNTWPYPTIGRVFIICYAVVRTTVLHQNAHWITQSCHVFANALACQSIPDHNGHVSRH